MAYHPKDDKKDDDLRVAGTKDKSGIKVTDYGPKKIDKTKQPKDLNEFVANPHQDGSANDKPETTGNYTGKKEGEKIYTHEVDCPPGKDPKEWCEAEANRLRAKGYLSPVKVKCKDKTDTKQGSGSKAGTGQPGNPQELPQIDVAGQGQLKGAGKTVTNPVDLQNKVVDFRGQQYFNPQGGLPTPPSGYSWQGTDYATLINNSTRNALSVAQTLQLFNGQSQSSARGPSTAGGGGTNPAPLPNTSFGFNQTISTPISDAVYGTARGVSDTQLLYDTIIKSEGTGKGGRNPYDTAGGYNEKALPKPVSQMTLAEVRYWGSYIRGRGLFPTTAMGAFQIVNGTRDLAQRGLGLTDSTIYSPEVQQKMASWIARKQGLSAWEGLNINPGLMSTARAELAKGGQVGSYQIATGNSSFPYGIGAAGSSQTPIGGGGSAGGTGGSSTSNAGSSPGGGAGAGGSGSSFDIQYKRNSPQQEGQGGYIAQAAAASIAARTGNLGGLGNLTSQLGLGGLASNALGAFGGPTATGSVSPNYNVPNWSGGSSGGGGVSSASDTGVNPASAIGTIPNNSATLFPTSLSDFSSVGNSLGSVPNAYTNLPTTAPLAATNDINSNLGAAANQVGISQTPTGQYGQFGQSITSPGGSGNSKKKEGEAESKEQKSERPTQTTKRMNRAARKEFNSDKELDKDLDKKVPLPPKRPDDLSAPLTHSVTRRKNEGDEGPENPSVTQAPGVDPHAFTSDMSGIARNLTGAIPGLESLMSRIPNQLLGSFMGNMPAGLQSLLPQGLIPGLNLGPVSLNNMLQMVGGGALGGMAGQLIRSMSGGIPVASMLTQSLQSVPISQVFGSLGQSVGTSAAAISNTLGSITNVASMGMGGIPVNSAQLNQAISYAVASAGSSLSIPINTIGIAGQVINNPIGSLVNIAMGGMIANGSVPILPTNLSGTNAALLSGLNQQIPQEDAQMILTIGQITNLLPPNVRNMIPQTSPSAFGGPTNYVQNSRNNSARQTDPSQVHGGGSGGGGGNQIDFKDAEKTNIGDTRNVPYGMKLSDHYTLYDLTTGVAVSHGCHPLLPLHGMTVDEVVHNLMLLARNILEPIRAEIGPFTINSGFRGDDPTTKRNKNWERSLHGYGRAADLSWGSAGRIAQAHAFAAARLHATENLHEGTWLHIAVANGIGGKGGVASSRRPEGNIEQGVNTYKGYPGQVGGR